MSLGHVHWRGRHKRRARRVANDLRQAAPLIGLVACFAGAAGVTATAQYVPSVLVDRAALATLPAERPPVGAAPPPESPAPRTARFAPAPAPVAAVTDTGHAQVAPAAGCPATDHRAPAAGTLQRPDPATSAPR